MKKVLVAILCCLSLLLPVVFTTGCAVGGGSGGGNVMDPDSLARSYVEALLAGDAAKAKEMVLANYQYKDEFVAHTDKAIAVLSQYEGKNVTVSTSRPWSGGESGEVDKRTGVQFEYRKKGSSADFETGVLYVRVTSVGGGWGIADIVLGVPDA